MVSARVDDISDVRRAKERKGEKKKRREPERVALSTGGKKKKTHAPKIVAIPCTSLFLYVCETDTITCYSIKKLQQIDCNKSSFFFFCVASLPFREGTSQKKRKTLRTRKRKRACEYSMLVSAVTSFIIVIRKAKERKRVKKRKACVESVPSNTVTNNNKHNCDAAVIKSQATKRYSCPSISFFFFSALLRT